MRPECYINLAAEEERLSRQRDDVSRRIENADYRAKQADALVNMATDLGERMDDLAPEEWGALLQRAGSEILVEGDTVTFTCALIAPVATSPQRGGTRSALSAPCPASASPGIRTGIAPRTSCSRCTAPS